MIFPSGHKMKVVLNNENIKALNSLIIKMDKNWTFGNCFLIRCMRRDNDIVLPYYLEYNGIPL